MDSLDHHKHPATWEEAAADVPAGTDPVLIAVGQYSPGDVPTVRVGILVAHECVSDRWLKEADIKPLAQNLAKNRKVRHGEWDVMYATGWSFAWTMDGPPIQVWNTEDIVVWQEKSELVVRSRGRCAINAIDHIHAFVSGDWTLRGVRLVVRGGAELIVAQEEDPIAQIDPTYDNINLSCEIAWAVSLAEALGKALKKSVKTDDPL